MADAPPPPIAVHQIFPYRLDGGWVFDSDEHGLVQEGLVGGTDDIIDELLRRAGLTGRPFALRFGDGPFPGSAPAAWVRPEGGGNVYHLHGIDGWLCPNFLLYFARPPAVLHVAIVPA